MEKLFKTVGDYAYIHVSLGSDLFGDGSIEKPYASFLKADSVFPSKAKVLSGILVENITATGKTIIGDEKWQEISMQKYLPSGTKVSNIRTYGGAESSANCIFTYACNAASSYSISNSFSSSVGTFTVNQNTMNDTQSNTWGSSVGNENIINNSIIAKTVGLVLSNPINRQYKYCVFPSKAAFSNASNPAFGDDPVENVRILKRILDPTWSEFGSLKTVDTIFYAYLSNGQKIETCRIVKEQKDGGILPNIFNSYELDAVTPKDFYLNPDPQNAALTANEFGDYAGALMPAYSVGLTNTVNNVNPSTGNNSGVGVLLNTNDPSGFIVSNDQPETYQGQTWNRMLTNVFEYNSAAKFEGVNNYSFYSGQSSGIYVGKKQTVFGGAIHQAGGKFTVQPDKRYKVLDSSPSTTQISGTGIAIKKTGQSDVNVFRNQTFATPSDLSGYTYQAQNANVTLIEVLSPVYESFEVRPYENLTTPSAFPAFSSPANEKCLLLYHKTGAKTGSPVLFSEIANNKHSYFQGFAVSNADREYYALLSDADNYYSAGIALRYFSIEVNIHYDPNIVVG